MECRRLCVLDAVEDGSAVKRGADESVRLLRRPSVGLWEDGDGGAAMCGWSELALGLIRRREGGLNVTARLIFVRSRETASNRWRAGRPLQTCGTIRTFALEGLGVDATIEAAGRTGMMVMARGGFLGKPATL